MDFQLDKRRNVIAALLLLALANISVMMMRSVDADIWLYQVRIDCFSQQFWQGDLYPRWCMSANAGLGSSVFLFYFPLPFYVAALFYPLTYLGVDSYQLFVLLCFLATFLTALASYHWLRDIVTPGAAILASGLMLFVPYRLEVLYFRGAYAEIWVMALLPLLFKYTRRIARGEGGVLPLALVSGASLLTHVPSTISAFLFSGVYMLVMTGREWKPKLHYGVAVLWGVVLTAFYLLPGTYYQQFLAPVQLVDGFYGWANGFLSLAYLSMSGLERPVIAVILTVLWLFALIPPVLNKRTQTGDAFVEREVVAWVVLGLCGLFMLLPVSLPLYKLIGPLAKVVFPWRMQVIFVLAIGYLLAVRMCWMFSPGRKGTWKLDYGIAVLFLWLVGQILVVSYGPTAEALNTHIRAAQIIFSNEYRSQWTEEDYWKYPYLLALHDNEATISKAIITSGRGSVRVKHWGWDGIDLQTNTRKEVTVRVSHSYFPVWKGTLDGDAPLFIFPEEKNGQMMFDVPAGEHNIHIAYSIMNGNSTLAYSQWASLMALIALAFAALKAYILQSTMRGKNE